MSRTPRIVTAWLALATLLASCQSVPTADVETAPPESSLLAVDIRFPAPWNREASLVQVYFVKKPDDDQADKLPELITATFVKWHRAYLLDPEPGTYYVVAATAAYAPPWNNYRIAGVTHTRWSGTSADALIFPAELVYRTKTTIAAGQTAFMGALRIRAGKRINARAEFADGMQRLIAERIRPGVAFNSGLSGWLKRTWMVDPEESTISNGMDDRESFVEVAVADLDGSLWAQVVARMAPGGAIANTPPPAKADAPVPERIASTSTAGPTPRTTPTPSAAPTPKAAPTSSTVLLQTAAPTLSTVPPPTAAPTPSATSTPVAAPTQSDAPTRGTPLPERIATAPTNTVVQPVTTQTTMLPKAADAKPVFAALAPNVQPPPDTPPPVPKSKRFPGGPPGSSLSEIEFGMSDEDVRTIMGKPDDRADRVTAKAWIPFYDGPDAILREWIYDGEGRVVFTLHRGSLDVHDVVYESDPYESDTYKSDKRK